MMCFHDTLTSPLGVLELEASDRGLTAIRFPKRTKQPPTTSARPNEHLRLAKEELSDYFSGQLASFSVPLDWQGTEFQIAVWQALLKIPLGETWSYADVARAVHRPKSARPVGGAVGRNPLPIIVPCHRVVGSDGSLTGFTGGLDIKIKLLALEGVSAH